MGLAFDEAEAVGRHVAHDSDRQNEGENSEHAPETELAAQSAAVGDGFGVDGHGLISCVANGRLGWPHPIAKAGGAARRARQ